MIEPTLTLAIPGADSSGRLSQKQADLLEIIREAGQPITAQEAGYEAADRGVTWAGWDAGGARDSLLKLCDKGLIGRSAGAMAGCPNAAIYFANPHPSKEVADHALRQHIEGLRQERVRVHRVARERDHTERRRGQVAAAEKVALTAWLDGVKDRGEIIGWADRMEWLRVWRRSYHTRLAIGTLVGRMAGRAERKLERERQAEAEKQAKALARAERKLERERQWQAERSEVTQRKRQRAQRARERRREITKRRAARQASREQRQQDAKLKRQERASLAAHYRMLRSPTRLDAPLREHPGLTLGDAIAATTGDPINEVLANELDAVVGDLSLDDIDRMGEQELARLRKRVMEAGLAPPSVQRAERERLADTTPHHGRAPSRTGRVGMAHQAKSRSAKDRSARHKSIGKRYTRREKERPQDGWGGVVLPEDVPA